MDGETNGTAVHCSPILQGWTQHGWAGRARQHSTRGQVWRPISFEAFSRDGCRSPAGPDTGVMEMRIIGSKFFEERPIITTSVGHPPLRSMLSEGWG